MQGGKTVLAEFKAGHSFAYAFDTLTDLSDNEKNAVSVYLAEKEGNKVQAGTNWNALTQKEASVFQIRIGTLEAGKLALGPALFNTLRKILDIRVSPAGNGHRLHGGRRQKRRIAAFRDSDGRLRAAAVGGQKYGVLCPIGRWTAIL